MSNPYKPFTAEWAAREAELARKGLNTGTSNNSNELARIQRENDTRRQSSGGGSDSGCFPATARIRTASGERPIAQINPGDFVVTWEAANCWKVSRVLRVFVHSPRKLSSINFANGTSCRTTPNHTFLTKRGWVTAAALKAGDQVQNGPTGNGFNTVQSVTPSDHAEPVFNLITANQFNFVVDGVVAHNFTRVRTLQMALWNARELCGSLVTSMRIPLRRSVVLLGIRSM